MAPTSVDATATDGGVRRATATSTADATLDEFGDRMLRDRNTVHFVTGDGGDVVGVVTLDDLKTARGGDHGTTRVSSVMREVPRVDSTADAFDTLSLLNGAGTVTALVEENGSVVGVLSESDYAHAMTVGGSRAAWAGSRLSSSW
ncbi:CBS domain-containing protein [Haloplanus salilacus]|uniref:CBS domain-containing protein n=1 Tax=Haloplanus salilacus TaxID=2949994 RepID=UPI0030CEC10B